MSDVMTVLCILFKAYKHKSPQQLLAGNREISEYKPKTTHAVINQKDQHYHGGGR